jgi:hypothetical protein
MNSEFGIRNSEFPSTLPRENQGGRAGIQNSKFKIQNLESPPTLPPEQSGVAGSIQNSKFKIQDSVAGVAA